MEEDTQKPLTLAEARELDYEFGLDQSAARDLQAELDAANERAGKVDELQAQLDAANERADQAEKARDRAKAKAKAVAGEQPAKLRKFGAMDDAADDFAAAIGKADKVEVVLSDGKGEIEGIAPVVVTGEAWRATPNGLMLTEAVEIDGPGPNKAAYNVDGYALVLDGKQVAYRKRPDPVTVVPGQHYKIENDIIF